MIVDYEYAGMGDIFFDLGNLSVNNEFDEDADLTLPSFTSMPPPLHDWLG